MADLIKVNPTTGLLDLVGSSAASGDVVGPISSTDNAIVRFDGITGKLIQNSGLIIDDSSNLLSTSDGINNLGSNSIQWNNLFTYGVQAWSISLKSNVDNQTGFIATDLESSDVLISQTFESNIVPHTIGLKLKTQTLKDIVIESGNSIQLVSSDQIKLQNGSQGTIGHVWTQTAADGSGSWTSLPTFGDVVGPNSSIDNSIPTFDGITGKLIQSPGFALIEVSNLLPDTWGSDLASIVLDGTHASGQIGTGLGLLYKGTDNNGYMVIGTQDISDSTLSSSIQITTGYNSGTGGTGSLYLYTGISSGTTGNTGGIELICGDSAATNGSGGPITIKSGASTGTGTGGDITIVAGSSELAANAGSINITTGNTPGTGTSGNLNLTTGTSGSGNSGNLTLFTGLAGGTRGKIKLQDGSQGTIGHVWTQTAADGSGAWQASPGANTALSNLTTTSINQDLLPADATKNLGTTSGAKIWNMGFLQQIQIRTNTASERGYLGHTIVSPTGQNAHLYLQGPAIDTANATLVSTWSSNVSSVNPTADILLETGNKTLGTGDSGGVKITTGSSVGGASGNIILKTNPTFSTTRGYIQFDSLVAVLPTGVSDPSTSYPNGSTYYNTSDNTLRILNGGTWRSVALT